MKTTSKVHIKDCSFEVLYSPYMIRRVILLLLGFGLLLGGLTAQDTNPLAPNFVELDYSNKKTYHIAQVNITGAERRDDNAIKSITGLREGQTIEIPSERLSRAVNELWRLRLFSDVEIVLDKLVQDSVYLTIQLKEQPILSGYQFKNVRKIQQENLIEELGETFRIGGIISENDRNVGANKLKQYYIDKGFLDAEVSMVPVIDTVLQNTVKMHITVKKNKKVKIDQINFIGNQAIKDKKLRKQLKDTKKKGTLLKKSKFVKSDYEADKKNLIQFFILNGHSDAQIIRDSVWRNDKGLVLSLIHI